jgi:hypothetical protein
MSSRETGAIQNFRLDISVAEKQYLAIINGGQEFSLDL